MWNTAAEWHAALNDLPPALFLMSVVFDVLGVVTRRDSLKAAGFWTLIAAALGAVAALSSGLIAEGVIEHGGAAHEVMERHETLAKLVTAGLLGLAGWRIWRRGMLGSKEQPAYLGIAVLGLGTVMYLSHLGGTIVFRHGGGVPTDVLESALEERAAGHEHTAGEEHEHTADSVEVDTARAAGQPSSGDTGHAHAPGTPPHQH